MKITIACANIQNTPDISRLKVKRCAKIIAREGPDFVGFQEIRDHGEDAADILRGLSHHNYRLHMADLSTPIAVDRRFWVKDSDYFRFHKGDRSIPTPERGAVAAVVRRKAWPGPPLTVINAHPINKAFNNKDPEDRDRRAEMWWKSWEVLNEVISMYYEDGENIIMTGDFNKTDVSLFGRAPGVTERQVRWVAGEDGILKIGVLPQPGYTFKLLKSWRVPIPSDKSALFAKVRLR